MRRLRRGGGGGGGGVRPMGQDPRGAPRAGQRRFAGIPDMATERKRFRLRVVSEAVETVCAVPLRIAKRRSYASALWSLGPRRPLRGEGPRVQSVFCWFASLSVHKNQLLYLNTVLLLHTSRQEGR